MIEEHGDRGRTLTAGEHGETHQGELAVNVGADRLVPVSLWGLAGVGGATSTWRVLYQVLQDSGWYWAGIERQH